MEIKIILLMILAAILFFGLGVFFLMEYITPGYFTIDTISDGEFVRIANETIEAQKFLEKYPNATAHVDRSDGITVDFIIESTKKDSYGSTYHLGFSVNINPQNFKMGAKSVFCYNNVTEPMGTTITDKILEYIETEKCISSLQ